jgi:hypothetical protein
VSLRERHIDQPDPTTGLITLKIGIVVVQESEDSGDDDRDTLAIRSCPCF